jgi:hypothetical protein
VCAPGACAEAFGRKRQGVSTACTERRNDGLTKVQYRSLDIRRRGERRPHLCLCGVKATHTQHLCQVLLIAVGDTIRNLDTDRLQAILAHRRAYSAGSGWSGPAQKRFDRERSTGPALGTRLTGWEYVGAVLCIEPPAVDLADVLADVPARVEGPARVSDAGLGVARHVGAVSCGGRRLEVERWLVHSGFVVRPLGRAVCGARREPACVGRREHHGVLK